MAKSKNQKSFLKYGLLKLAFYYILIDIEF